MADSRAVVHAYRHLYRQGLKTISYSTPARYVLLRTLRDSFRSAASEDFDPSRISRTLLFLQRAAATNGFEHRIVRNLLTTRYWEQPLVKSDLKIITGRDSVEIHLRKSARAHFNTTLIMLNESLGTCLRYCLHCCVTHLECLRRIPRLVHQVFTDNQEVERADDSLPKEDKLLTAFERLFAFQPD